MGMAQSIQFFAPEKVHETLKDHNKGTKFLLTKTAVEKNKKLVQDYVIEFPDNGKQKEEEVGTDYYDAMLKSYDEATKIQNKFSAVNLNQCAVTLFIARTKTNGNGYNNYPKE